MSDYIGLAMLLLPAAALLAGFVRLIRNYNPDGDKCPHGVRMPQGLCRECGGTAVVVTDDPLEAVVAMEAWRTGRPVLGTVDENGKLELKFADEMFRRD